MDTPFDPKTLMNTWVHSHEEDGAGLQVFRPAHYPFPPARGRDALTLNADGSLLRQIPGPDDRSAALPAGSWQLQGRRLTLQQHKNENKEFSIESLDPEKLLLRPLAV